MTDHNKYSEKLIPNLEFTKHVKKRPFMYIGSIIELIFGLITDCIELSETDDAFFEIRLLEDNCFEISISTNSNIKHFLDHFHHDKINFNNTILPQVLSIISSKFNINLESESKTTISFSFNKDIVSNTTVDYIKLTDKAIIISLLNKKVEILTLDKRQKYFSQNYYHFPEGIFYLFNQVKKNVLGKPKFIITIDERIDSNEYQIGLAYRTDWFPNPHIQSFANNIETKCGGSLVDGIFDGLKSACKSYVKNKELTTFKIKQKKLLNGLIIICSIRGEKFKFGGSFKETLENEIVYKQAKELARKYVLEEFNSNKETANEFLWRFDKTQLTSGMY